MIDQRNNSMKKVKRDLKDVVFRAVVSDVDGTIAGTEERPGRIQGTERRISLEVIRAFRRLEDNGIPVMLASGNVVPVMRTLAIYLGLSGPMICENGGVIIYRDNQYLLSDRAEAERALGYLEDKGLKLRRSATDLWRLTEVALTVDEKDVPIIKQHLLGFELTVQYTGYALHLTHKSVSKQTGLLKACEILGVNPCEVVAFGDSENDISIISNCGYGVAVANATDELKSIADMVTEKPYGKGVAEGLKKIFGRLVEGECE